MSGFRSGPRRVQAPVSVEPPQDPPAAPESIRFDTGEQLQGVQPIDTPEQNLMKDYVFDLNGKIIGGWRVDEVVGVHRDLLPPDWYWDMNVTPPEIVDPEGNRWSPDVMTNEELLAPPTYATPELWDLFGSDDPRFVTYLKAMKRRDLEKYEDLRSRYLGNIGENYFAISELLSMQYELEDMADSGTGKPWRWPPKLYQQYLRAQSLENQGVTGDVGLLYKNAVLDAMVLQPFWNDPNLDAPPDEELTDNLWATTPLAFAEMNLFMFEMIPFIQEGRANLRSWHELRDTYAIPLVKLWNTKDEAVILQGGDAYAGALLIFLQYMETGKPDYINWDGVVENDNQIYWGRYYANLASSQILRQESTDWLNLEPNVYDLSQAFAMRIMDAREFYLQQHRENVPSGFHLHPSLAVQGTGGVFDPQKPLLDWLNENPGSLDQIRAHMVPVPPNNASFLQMSEQDFMDRATEGLKTLTGFPDPRLILDPFFQNDIVVFGDTLTPADRLRYPFDVKNDTGFWVRQTSAEDKYLGSKLFHNYEFIAYLLYYIFREKVFPILEENTEQYLARKADEVRDILKALVADPYQFEQYYEPGKYPWANGGDPNDYVPEMVERAIAAISGKIAAENFVGVTSEDIAIMANKARATDAVRSIFDQAWDAGLVDTEMGGGINAPGFTVDEDLLADDLAELGDWRLVGWRGLNWQGLAKSCGARPWCCKIRWP